MKRVLVVHYSQSGQLDAVVDRFTEPLRTAQNVVVTFARVQPETPYPFPWPFFRFLDTFPETVYMDPPALKPLELSGDEDFDLIILAYQVWFLSPSLPITGFLKSPLAARLLDGKPVLTLIVCRNMWLMAQEEVKRMLADMNARLVGNVALVDEAGSIGSFLATPIWVLTGKKGPLLGGWIPRAGVSDAEIDACDRFGRRILERLDAGKLDETLLTGLNAVQVNEKLISSEKTGKRAFLVWGRLFRALGPSGSWRRKPLLALYSCFLVMLIMTVVPLNILIKTLLAPFTRERVQQQKDYFSRPSGS